MRVQTKMIVVVVIERRCREHIPALYSTFTNQSLSHEEETLDSYVITRMLPKLKPELLPEGDEEVGQAYLECNTVS